jgi:predicted  nucleic acid-binding Zn-ribbon protein
MENNEKGNFTSPVKDDDDGQNGPKDDKDEISVTSPTTTNVASTPTRISLTSATPGYRAELSRLQTKISTLETDLRKKNAECASLQSSLDFMSKGAEQSTHDAVRMYAMGALAMSGGAVKGTTPVKASPRRSLVAEMKLEGKVSGDEDEYDEEEEEEEGVVNQAAAAVSRALVERNDELKKQLSDLTSVNADLQHRISETEERMSNITQRFERANENYQTEKQARNEDTKTFTSEKAVLTSQLSSLERELKVLQERVSDKSTSQDHSHLTLTKLRAEVTSLQRKNEEILSRTWYWIKNNWDMRRKHSRISWRKRR